MIHQFRATVILGAVPVTCCVVAFGASIWYYLLDPMKAVAAWDVSCLVDEAPCKATILISASGRTVPWLYNVEVRLTRQEADPSVSTSQFAVCERSDAFESAIVHWPDDPAPRLSKISWTGNQPTWSNDGQRLKLERQSGVTHKLPIGTSVSSVGVVAASMRILLWTAGMFVAATCISNMCRTVRNKGRIRKSRCPDCSYPLSGSAAEYCSECGWRRPDN